jgi:hypothetical protein
MKTMMVEHFERMNEQSEKHFERTKEQLKQIIQQEIGSVRESLWAVHDRKEQLVEQLSNKIEITTQEIRHIELNICEKKEQPQANEDQGTKETDESSSLKRRHGEREAPNK